MDRCAFPAMHYALIAAGEGSRLKEEGVLAPKPLVEIQGKPMIERLIGIFMRNGAKSISVICNEQMSEVKDYLLALQHSNLFRAVDADGNPFVCPLNVIVQTTESSMHSLAALMKVIPEGKFCLATVDTIFSEAEFSSFIRAFTAMPEDVCDGLFAVTPFVDDEKPLWVGINPQNFFSCACEKPAEASMLHPCPKIIGFYDQEKDMPSSAGKTVSGGIYCLDTRWAFSVLQDCLSKGQSRMRNYQRALISAGLNLRAYVFPKIMDIDHASDIDKAEAWLASESGKMKKRKILAIAREEIYSPNNEQKDAAIWRAVQDRLRIRGWQIDVCSEKEWAILDLDTVSGRYNQIIHMARRMRSLMRLEQIRMPIVNRPQAVRTVAKSRELTLTLLQQAGVNVPAWWAYDPEEDEMFCCEPHLQSVLPAWVKAMREDGARPEDVCFVQTPLEADTCIVQHAAMNIPDIIVMHHEDGDLVKCYAVLKSSDQQSAPLFLRWFYPQETNYSKFGMAEMHNMPLAQIPFDEQSLSVIALKIGHSLGLQVFGFDVIVRPDGTLVVIDVNDWPSFSMFREEAADAIASVIDETEEFNKKK